MSVDSLVYSPALWSFSKLYATKQFYFILVYGILRAADECFHSMLRQPQADCDRYHHRYDIIHNSDYNENQKQLTPPPITTPTPFPSNLSTLRFRLISLLAGHDEWSTHFIYILYTCTCSYYSSIDHVSLILYITHALGFFTNIVLTEMCLIFFIEGGERGFAFCETQFGTRTQVSPHRGSIHSICCSYCNFNMYLHIQNILKTKQSLSLLPPPFPSQVTSNVFWLWQSLYE